MADGLLIILDEDAATFDKDDARFDEEGPGATEDLADDTSI